MTDAPDVRWVLVGSSTPDPYSEPVSVHCGSVSLFVERLGWCANAGSASFPMDLKVGLRRREDQLVHKDSAEGFD